MSEQMIGKQHRDGWEHERDEWCLQMGCKQTQKMVGVESEQVSKQHRGIHWETGGGWCSFYGCQPLKESSHAN